jgi:transcriptional repressor NrdR
MHCPVCNSADTRVVDSRIALSGLAVRRRRECDQCDYRFSTSEEVEEPAIMVVKRDGTTQQPYRREKIEAGLRKALEKRPYTAEQFHALVAAIERDLQKTRHDAVSSEEVGDIVMAHLRAFDQVAYVRFASVYRSFADVETFQAELGKLREVAGEKV